MLTASSGEAGLRVAADRRPQAVIVDGVMPGIDGATVIRRIRLDPALRDTPCLLMTAADDYATEVQMLEAGADGFVRKQQDLAVVLAKLAAVLRQTSGQPPAEPADGRRGASRVLSLSPDWELLRELGDALRADGYEVVTAASADDALQLLAAQPVDCIVFDFDGPDGRAACRRIKEVPQIGDTPLVMTGRHDFDMLDCLAAGADDYVRSVDGPDALRAHVRTQIRRKHSHEESRRIREELVRRELDAAEERAARQLAETRAALVEELEWRNRELEAFSGSVSHDLRGPLQIISSFAETMLYEDDEALGTQTRHRVRRIHAAAARMGDLVESLLILARASRGELRRRPVDLTATAWEVTAEVQARDPARKVDFTVQPAMTADADEGLLRVVLENLINNAVKFTGKVEHPAVEIGLHRGRLLHPGQRRRLPGRPGGRVVPAVRPAAQGRGLPRYGHRPDHRAPGRRAARRRDLGGRRGRPGRDVLVHAAAGGPAAYLLTWSPVNLHLSFTHPDPRREVEGWPRSGGGPADHLDDVGGRRGRLRVAVDRGHQRRGQVGGHRGQIRRDRGQGRVGEPGRRDVVDADHGQVRRARSSRPGAGRPAPPAPPRRCRRRSRSPRPRASGYGHRGGGRVERHGVHQRRPDRRGGAGGAGAVQAGVGEDAYPGVVRIGVAQPGVTGRDQVIGLQPADPLLRHLELAAALPGPAEQRHHQGHPGRPHGVDLVVGEVREGQHGGRGDGLPDVGDRAVLAAARVHDEGQAVPGQRGGQVGQQVADLLADRPVGQQAEHHVRAAGAQRTGGRGRRVAEARGGVQNPAPVADANGYTWNQGYLWNQSSYGWQEANPWAEGTLPGIAAPMSINAWVAQE